MSNLLDRHAKNLKFVTKRHGRPIVLIDSNDVEYPPVMSLFNAVEWGLKITDIDAPLGEKCNIFIDRDSLQTEAGEIIPEDGWKVVGSPNSYDEEKTYLIEIPKTDKQLPSGVYFLSEIVDDAVKWPEVE